MGTSHGHSRDTGVWYHLQDLVLSPYGTTLVSSASPCNYRGETASFSTLGPRSWVKGLWLFLSCREEEVLGNLSFCSSVCQPLVVHVFRVRSQLTMGGLHPANICTDDISSKSLWMHMHVGGLGQAQGTAHPVHCVKPGPFRWQPPDIYSAMGPPGHCLLLVKKVFQ